MSQKKTSGTTPASPQQEAQRASLFVAFIGGALIGAAFLWTVFELELLPGQDDMAMPGMASGGGSHSMQAKTLIATDDWPSPPTLDTAIQPDPVGGWNLNLNTTNFTFDAAAAGRDNAEGYGHAHVYVNGMKLGRVYGDWYHIGSLPLGRNEVSVSLYANDHSGLSAGGSKITSTRTVIVE
ncbi:MAG: hypothetical protein VX665_05330 [Pseudomonadota bacterium]|nr:hypothetical protein [Pseudomonadota bacterium]